MTTETNINIDPILKDIDALAKKHKGAEFFLALGAYIGLAGSIQAEPLALVIRGQAFGLEMGFRQRMEQENKRIVTPEV